MAREAIKLSVEAIGNKIRYKKMYRRKVWKSKLYPSDSRLNRREAWRAFCEWRDKHRRADEVAVAVRKADQLLIAMSSGERSTPERSAEMARYFAAQAEALESVRTENDIPAAMQAAADVQARFMQRISPTADLCAQVQAERYAEHYRRKAESGQGSFGRFGAVRSDLGRFVEWYGAGETLDEVTSSTVSDYFSHLMAQVKAGANPNTISKAWTQFKTFIRDCAEEYPDDIIIPPNLDSRKFRFRKVRPEVEHFSVEECKLLLSNCSEATELNLLLMLNCAFYQSDVADLLASEIQVGRIVRPRSKTSGIKVNWLLWDRTWELLRKQAEPEGRALLNSKGEPLVQNGISPNGNEWRKDAVASRYWRVVNKLKKRKELPKAWRKTLKMFRKTGANLLEKSEDHAAFYELYLNHSSVAKRHYIKDGEPVPRFDAAIVWLGEQLGYQTTHS